MQQYMRSANTVSRVLINRFKKIKICKPVSLYIGIIPDKKKEDINFFAYSGAILRNTWK